MQLPKKTLKPKSQIYYQEYNQLKRHLKYEVPFFNQKTVPIKILKIVHTNNDSGVV